MSIVLGASLSRSLVESHNGYVTMCLERLRDENVLTISVKEAQELLELGSVSVTSRRSVAARAKRARELEGKVVEVRTKKPEMVLPFCGVIVSDWCNGVRFNHGLHTQCTQKKINGGKYCKTCQKQADNSSTGMPTYGDIKLRAVSFGNGEFYRDPKGKQSVPFANVAKKLNLDIAAAQAAAGEMGWTIADFDLVEKKAKRGRPAKSAAVSDTDSEGEPQPKKKRGRPKKAPKKATTDDDMIAKLVAEAGENLKNLEISGEEKTSEPAEKTKKPSKTELKKEVLKKECEDMGLTISEEEFSSMKIGEIRKRMAAYKKENKKKKKTEAIVETAPVEKELESQPVESEVAEKKEEVAEQKDDDNTSIESEADEDNYDYDDDDEVSLPKKEIGGETYLFDANGDYAGIENLVLTLDGKPIGTWDASEPDQVQFCEFDEEEE